jgi:hypothetical protein
VVHLNEYHSDYTEDKKALYDAYCSTVMSGEDQHFGQLIGKLQKALSADAFTNEEVVM